MIASIVATFCDSASKLRNTLDEVRLLPQLELGSYTENCRRIPMTIDSSSREDMETVTRWLQDRPEVLFVDVVFVHFEDANSPPAVVADTAGSSIPNRELN